MLGAATVSVAPKSPPAWPRGGGRRARYDRAEAALGGTEEWGHQEVLGDPTRHPPLVSKVTGSENSPATALLHARTRKFMYFMSNFSPAGTAGSQTGHGEVRRRNPVLGTATQTFGSAPGARHPQQPP